MSDIEIRDDRAAGRLEAVQGDEVVGRVEYFVLDEPARALVPVHTVVEPAHEALDRVGRARLWAGLLRHGVRPRSASSGRTPAD